MKKRIIAEKIRIIIQRSGIPQKDLAAQAGITPVTLSRWLQQKREPRLTELTRLAEVLNVSVDDFCDETADNDELSLEEWKERALKAEEQLRTLESRFVDETSKLTPEEYLAKLRYSMRFVFNFLSQDTNSHG